MDGSSRLFHSFWAVYHKVGRKREIPEKKHLTTRKQNWLVSHMARAWFEHTAVRLRAI